MLIADYTINDNINNRHIRIYKKKGHERYILTTFKKDANDMSEISLSFPTFDQAKDYMMELITLFIKESLCQQAKKKE